MKLKLSLLALVVLVLLESCASLNNFTKTPTAGNCVKITVSDSTTEQSFYYCNDKAVNSADEVIKKLRLLK